MLTHDHNFLEEYGVSHLVGCDEAGRGPLAGPLVVAGVLFPNDVVIEGLNDSKKLSEGKRILLEPEIKAKSLAYHVEVISLEIIEKLNIYQASKFGMIECFNKIRSKIDVSLLLTDAMPISFVELPNVNVIPIIKGDQKSFHIAGASVLAKVARDRIMKELHLEFPEYAWDKNKGYPTKYHRQMIAEHGISPYHRQGFKLL